MNHDTYITAVGQKIRLLNNNILVKIDPLPEVSASGLVLYPNGAMEHVNNTGTVVAFGYVWVETEEGEKKIPSPKKISGVAPKPPASAR